MTSCISYAQLQTVRKAPSQRGATLIHAARRNGWRVRSDTDQRNDVAHCRYAPEFSRGLPEICQQPAGVRRPNTVRSQAVFISSSAISDSGNTWPPSIINVWPVM
jgi:hypothetical protein